MFADIDPEISQSQREKANLLIQQELPKDYLKTLHTSIAELPASKLTNTLAQEIERIAAGRSSVGGVDLTRYENSEEVSHNSNDEALQDALRTAYTNLTYLKGRQTNIGLLEDYGKNAWLIGNSHIEDIQKRLDAELATLKSSSESTNKARKASQEESRGELIGLEETWKEGIGKIIETQVATDALRQDLVRKRNAPASGADAT